MLLYVYGIVLSTCMEQPTNLEHKTPSEHHSALQSTNRRLPSSHEPSSGLAAREAGKQGLRIPSLENLEPHVLYRTVRCGLHCSLPWEPATSPASPATTRARCTTYPCRTVLDTSCPMQNSIERLSPAVAPSHKLLAGGTPSLSREKAMGHCVMWLALDPWENGHEQNKCCHGLRLSTHGM